MATRTITIKPEYVAEMIEIFGEQYTPTLPGDLGQPDIPNPETKADFAGRMFDIEVKTHIQQIVIEYRKRMLAAVQPNSDEIITM